jgi:hypothetical protein
VLAPAKSDKRNFDLEKVFNFVDFSSVRYKQNDMIIGFDNGVMMRHDNVVAANKRNDVRAPRQVQFLDFSTDNSGPPGISMSDSFNSLGSTAPQGMHLDNIAASHMGKQRSNGYLLR